MKRISKRTLLVASSVLATTALVGIPAGVVYATKTEIGRNAIAQNIEQKLEDSIFGSINLMPANKSGTFDTTRMSDNETKLNDLKKQLGISRKVFTREVKARIPAYGIINDTLNVHEHFDSWEKLVAQANKVIDDINNKNWDSLESSLYENEDGGQGLVSKSYGIERKELNGISDYTEVNILTSYKVKNAFVSFGEYTEGLKGTEISLDQRKAAIKSILSALSIITGQDIPFTDLTGHNPIAKLDINEKPGASVAWMIYSLEDQSQTATDSSKIDELLDQWRKNILPSWNDRFNAIDQFFDDTHNPISKGDIKDVTNLNAFEYYDKSFHSENPGSSSLSESIETFMDDFPIQNKIPVSPEFDSLDFVTNFDFLRLFFGNDLEELIQSSGTAAAAPSRAYSGVEGWDNIMKMNKDVQIDQSGISTSVGVQSYWNAIVHKIFEGSEFPTMLKDNQGKLQEVAHTIFQKMTFSSELERSFLILKQNSEDYAARVAKINADSFSIGIKIKDIQNIISEYHITKDWKIKISSLASKTIGQEDLDNLISAMKYDKSGNLLPSSEFNYHDGYIYPSSPKWLLRPTDSMYLEGVNYANGTKLDAFENEVVSRTIFKPYIRINEDTDSVKVEILWDHIAGPKTGGKND